MPSTVIGMQRWIRLFPLGTAGKRVPHLYTFECSVMGWDSRNRFRGGGKVTFHLGEDFIEKVTLVEF